MTNDAEHIESTVISGLCRSPEAREKYLHRIHPTDFAYKAHRTVFDAINNLFKSGAQITRNSISAAVDGNAAIQMMVGFSFDSKLPDLSEAVFKQFKQFGARNRLVELKNYLEKQIKQNSEPGDTVEQLRGMIDRVESEEGCDLEVSRPEETSDATLAMIDRWAAGNDTYRTYIPELDHELFLSQLTGYTVIGGDSGGGKTALMCSIAKANARAGLPVLVFSLEMNKEMLWLRMAMESPRLRGLELTEANLSNPKIVDDIRQAINGLRALPIIIIDNVTSVFSIYRIARKLMQTERAGLVLVDYLQLCDTDPKDSDVVRVSTVSKVLKSLSIPDARRGIAPSTIVALSQYSESVTTGGPMRRAGADTPIKAMRWSRQIKMDSDLLLHLLPSEIEGVDENSAHIRIFCEKQRNYRAGWQVPVIFHKDTQSFSTRALDMQQRTIGHKAKIDRAREIKL